MRIAGLAPSGSGGAANADSGVWNATGNALDFERNWWGVSDSAQRATLYVLAFTVLRADEQGFLRGFLRNLVGHALLLPRKIGSGI